MVITLPWTPTWVAFGFRFTPLLFNEEYIEMEEEFDHEEKDTRLVEIELGDRQKSVSIKKGILDFDW